jgi:hypothetical protein
MSGVIGRARATQPPAPAPARRRHLTGALTVLGVAGVGAFMAFLDATIVNIAFPNILASFRGETRADVSWVLYAYNVVFASFLVSWRVAAQHSRATSSTPASATWRSSPTPDGNRLMLHHRHAPRVTREWAAS